MDLGKPISGIPKPAESPTPASTPSAPATGTPAPSTGNPAPATDDEQRDQLAEAPEPADRSADSTPVSSDPAEAIKIAMPGSWKFFYAWMLFFGFMFASNLTADLFDAGSRRYITFVTFAATYVLIAARIATASISGTATCLVVPFAGGVLRRQLADVVSVSLPDPQLAWSGTPSMYFDYGSHQMHRLILVTFRQANPLRSPLGPPTPVARWSYAALSALRSVGIRTIYTGAEPRLSFMPDRTDRTDRTDRS